MIEGHRIFTNQTVTDNLLLAAYDVPRAERDARVDEALSYFPEIVAKRYDRGSTLSGGQQQMLAVAQGLVRQPKLLMLDEPSAGLSPVLRRSRAGRRDKIAENWHGSITRGATNREGVGCRGSSPCARPGENCTPSLDGRSRSAAAFGARIFWFGGGLTRRLQPTSPLFALSGHAELHRTCPLLGVKQT